MRQLLLGIILLVLIGCGSPVPGTSVAPSPPLTQTLIVAPTAVPTTIPVPTTTTVPPTAAPTNSPLPPTAIPTSTTVPPTAVPTSIPPTAAPTNSPLPPTAIPTSTTVPPTAVPTSIPPTAAPTNSPVPPTAIPTSTTVPPTAAPAEGVVPAAIDGYGYFPESITIRVGGSVIWTNIDQTPHSATANDGAFDSGLLLQNQTYSYTFTQPGEYPYYCTRHGAMAGSVTVLP